jgi:hypothetical protein
MTLRAYGSVVQAKFEYEYSGDVFTPAAARRLLVKAEVFTAGHRNNWVFLRSFQLISLGVYGRCSHPGRGYSQSAGFKGQSPV